MSKPARPARLLKTHYIIPAIIAALVIPLVVSGFVWAKKGVTVVVDGKTAYYKTQAVTVGGLLSEADIAVHRGDVVSPAQDQPLEDASTVVVRHAVPVDIDCGGDILQLNVVGATVADAIVAAGLDPSAGLRVSPAPATPLTPHMTIHATDVFLRIEKEEVALPFKTVVRKDPTLLAGTRRVRAAGHPGMALRVYSVVVTGGKEGLRRFKGQVVVTAPVTEVVLAGTKRAPRVARVSRGVNACSAAPRGGRRLAVECTAYTPWDSGCNGLDSISRKMIAYQVPEGWGIVAVDASVIPLGSRLYVPGYGYAIAADTGGAVEGAHIDVCFWMGGPSGAHASAVAWGRRAVQVVVLP